jgi:molybdenum-dependent DNA-binding transcriptional regulator ModE
MTPLETEANPNIRVGPLRWGRPEKVQKLKELIDDGASISAAAREVGMSRVTAYKYLAG